jgi:transcriptional antiterminator NusG
VEEATEKKEPPATKWYAIHVLSGHERKVKAYIENEAKALSLTDRITNVLIPAEEVTEMREGKKTHAQQNLLSGLHVGGDDA